LAAIKFFGFGFNLLEADVKESALNSQTRDVRRIKIFAAGFDLLTSFLFWSRTISVALSIVHFNFCCKHIPYSGNVKHLRKLFGLFDCSQWTSAKLPNQI
jgi:hypothetical protein